MKRLIHDCYVLLKQIERFGEWERKKGRTACRVAALSIDGRITRRIRVRRPLTADITVRVDSLLGPQMTSLNHTRSSTRHPAGHPTLALGAPGTEGAAEGETGAARGGGESIRQREGNQRRLVLRVDFAPVLGLGDLVGLIVFNVGAIRVVCFVGIYRGGGFGFGFGRGRGGGTGGFFGRRAEGLPESASESHLGCFDA